jgi:hypothetical protein
MCWRDQRSDASRKLLQAHAFDMLGPCKSPSTRLDAMRSAPSPLGRRKMTHQKRNGAHDITCSASARIRATLSSIHGQLGYAATRSGCRRRHIPRFVKSGRARVPIFPVMRASRLFAEIRSVYETSMSTNHEPSRRAGISPWRALVCGTVCCRSREMVRALPNSLSTISRPRWRHQTDCAVLGGTNATQ